MSLRPRIHPLIGALEQGLLERETAARLMLLAALAGEHSLLLGPPGTAKSLLARRLHACFGGAPYFERLLTRFSTPEELFGPLSLKALEDDRYERLTRAYLPEAGVAFLDEVFKANSAILNALLTLLNEREFDNGAQRLHCPIVSVVGASNEWPSDESLLAFQDRFLVRIPVEPVSKSAFLRLLELPEPSDARPTPLAPEEARELREQARHVALSDDTRAALVALRDWLAEQDQPVSDRRWRQWIGMMRVGACAEDRMTLDRYDLWTAPYVLASSAAVRDALAAWLVEQVFDARVERAEWLERAVQAFERQADLEEQATDGEGDDAAGKMALARTLNRGDDGEEQTQMSRLIAQRLEEQLRRRYSSVHVATRLRQCQEVLEPLHRARDEREHRLQAAQSALQGRVCLPPSLLAQCLAAHTESLGILQGLADRMCLAQARFAALPQRDEPNASEPASPWPEPAP